MAPVIITADDVMVAIMTPAAARIFMRAVATFSGLVAFPWLCVGPFMLYQAFAKADRLMIGLTIFPLVLGLYFLYVAYIVWFKFSPLAVRHVCGMIGFYALMLLTKLPPDRTSQAPLLFLGGLIVAYFIYRATTRYFSRVIFPEPVLDVH